MAVMKSAKPSLGSRAWRLLRLSVLWARKGGAFRLVDVHSIRLFRTLRRRGDRLYYGEREFSIDETPAFRFRTPSARVLRMIPCITPAPGTFDDGDDDRYFFSGGREAGCIEYYCTDECDEESCADVEAEGVERGMDEASCTNVDAGEEDAGVDVKAEEFIAKFHAQMKLQRQIEWLQYNEMMERSLS